MSPIGVGPPLSIIRNQPSQFLLTFTLPAGQTMGDKEVIFTVKATPADPDSTNLFQKTSPSGGITITGDFTALVSIDAADTVSLDNKNSQELVYTCVLVDGPNDYSVAFESFTVVGNAREAIV